MKIILYVKIGVLQHFGQDGHTPKCIPHPLLGEQIMNFQSQTYHDEALLAVMIFINKYVKNENNNKYVEMFILK